MERPTLTVAVVMRKERVPQNPWQEWRWLPDEVTVQEGDWGAQPRLLTQDEQATRWLYPGVQVELFRDDAEGYYLNASSGVPSWFVLWRQDEAIDDGRAQVAAVSLSYNDAGRWLDAQERVDSLPLPPDVAQWLSAYAADNFQPEPKQRQRPQSFRPLTDRFGQPASISTGEKRRRPGGA